MKHKPILALHWQILIAMAVGIGFGILASYFGLQKFTRDFIEPFGAIFINLLKLIAIPLILASLIKGISDLKLLSRLSSMGIRAVVLYLCTTVVAVTLGLLIVNIIQPGKSVSEETRQSLLGNEGFTKQALEKSAVAEAQKDKPALQPLVDMVPDNIAKAAVNSEMLQVIFFAIFFGVGLILVDPAKAKPVKDFFDGFNDVIMKLVDVIMLGAPVGVFALMASIVTSTPDWKLFVALAWYAASVLLGLGIMIVVVYPTLVAVLAKKSPLFFFRGIAPAQLLAFSTSSSAATLPVTMERVEEHLGVHREVASFVLPIGATVNMDGTSLYQAVAAVFIAQVLGVNLDFNDQLTIVTTATLASIGSAAVPGAGMVMLVIVLGAIGVPESGLALIFAVDRILDMCRTSVNVTGDAAVSMVVAKQLGQLGPPEVQEWDDFYPPEKEEPQTDAT